MARSASLKIVNSDDSRVDDDKADKRPLSFIFDVFSEDDDGRINND